jgi:hypothetical protein
MKHMEKTGSEIPDEIAKEAPFPITSSSSSLKVATNFRNTPWIHEYSKGVIPTNEEFVQDQKDGRIIIGRALGPTLGLARDKFSYANSKPGGKCMSPLLLVFSSIRQSN